MDNDKKKEYPHLLQHFFGAPWAITETKLKEIQAFVIRKQAGELNAGISDNGGVREAKARPAAATAGNVAVLNVFGVVAQRMDMMSEFSGGVSTENLTKDLRAAIANPSIKAVVLNIDSPGGCVFGVQELADEIMNARGSKHIAAIANSMAGSAAYWIGAAADEFIVTPSGQVGSIGVYTMHEDWSEAMAASGVKTTFIQAGKFKTEGNPYQPLDEAAQKAMQYDVDFYYDSFVSAVAKGRNVSASIVKNNFGQGRMLNSKDAKAAGMVDRIDTLDGVLSRLGVNSATAQNMKSMHADTAARELDLLK